MKAVRISISVALAGLALAACGSESIDVADQDREGAELFAERCSGCHTLTPAGTQGSGNRSLRAQGPNLDERTESFEEALFAIRNGGFSGAIMPQNIVVGEEAIEVADFVAKYAGTEVESEIGPSVAGDDESSDESGASGQGQ